MVKKLCFVILELGKFYSKSYFGYICRTEKMTEMKLRLLFILTFTLLMACSPKVKTNFLKTYQPLDYKQEVVVIGLKEQLSVDGEKLGSVKAGDSGMSVKCGYEEQLNHLKVEARRVGGNVLKITRHRLPNLMTTSCHRVEADVYRCEDIKSLLDGRPKEVVEDVDYATLNIYRYAGSGSLVGYNLYLGDSLICRVKNNFKRSIKIQNMGEQVLWAKTEKKVELPITIEQGRNYYIKCDLTYGAMVGRPKMNIVPYHIGKSEFELFEAKNK